MLFLREPKGNRKLTATSQAILRGCLSCQSRSQFPPLPWRRRRRINPQSPHRLPRLLLQSREHLIRLGVLLVPPRESGADKLLVQVPAIGQDDFADEALVPIDIPDAHRGCRLKTDILSGNACALAAFSALVTKAVSSQVEEAALVARRHRRIACGRACKVNLRDRRPIWPAPMQAISGGAWRAFRPAPERYSVSGPCAVGVYRARTVPFTPSRTTMVSPISSFGSSECRLIVCSSRSSTCFYSRAQRRFRLSTGDAP